MLDAYLGDIYAIATAVSWSVAVIFFKWSSQSLATIPLKFFQNVVSGALLFISLVLIGDPVWVPFTQAEWLLIALSAIIGITAGDTFYVAAIRRLGAGPQALVDGLYSPFVIVLAYAFFGEILSAQVFWGAALILSAIILAHIDLRKFHVARKDLWIGLSYAVASQLAMAACVMLVRDLLRQHSVLLVTAYRFAVGTAVLLIIYSIRSGTKGLWTGFKPSKAWAVTIPGTLLGPYLATLLWFSGFKYTLAGKAAIYNQLSTIFIVILAAVFLHERLTVSRIAAVVLAVIGGLVVFGSS